MQYLDYFGFSGEPFSNAPVSRFYYGSHQHSKALRRLRYVATSMKGFAICVGDIGHGKTTLARRMLDSLPEEQFEAAMLVIVHGGITANWLLKRIASQLGVIAPADDKLTILSQLYTRLLELHREGKRAVVLIDEAQMLASRELMEEFRGMLNLEVPDHKLITFIFFGLPELEERLRLDPPLAQRIALRYQLEALSVADTAAYIRHRLRVAGASDAIALIPDRLMPEIQRLSDGVPRLINTLCDNLLLEMYFARLTSADSSILVDVGATLGLPIDRVTSQRQAKPLIDDLPTLDDRSGEDAIAAVSRRSNDVMPLNVETFDVAELPIVDPEAIAARIAQESEGEDEAAVQTTSNAEFVLSEHSDSTDGFDDIDIEVVGHSRLRSVTPSEPLPGSDDEFQRVVDEHGVGDHRGSIDLEKAARGVDAEYSLDHFDIEVEKNTNGPGSSNLVSEARGPHSLSGSHVSEPQSARAEAGFVSGASKSQVLPPLLAQWQPLRASPASPSKPVSTQSSVSRIVTTSTGSTIDLNEIDSLLADINRPIVKD